MEPFIVSARKYRPQSFKDVVGQEAITNTLNNAIEHNHLAQALLFCGPRGVGKTTCARILAKKINQEGTENPDEDFAFNIFELDAASNNSVDDIRNLIDQVRIPPQVGKYKVYIIDEVHMLSQSAFNAFLKTLEEPPKHAIFILATTEKHKIIPTILSRCQIFDFRRISVKDVAQYLKYIAEEQGIQADEDALHIIAQKADGAMRDALSIFDRVVSFSGKNLSRQAVTENLNVLDYDTYFEITSLLLDHDIPGALLLFNTVLSRGFEGHHFINGLASHFRDLLVCRNEDTLELLEVGEKAREQYREQSLLTSENFLLKGVDLCNSCDLNYRASKNQRLLVELTLMKIASLEFQGEKKNDGLNTDRVPLIPATYFKSANKPKTKTVDSPPPEGVSPAVIHQAEQAETKEALPPVETVINKTEEPEGIIAEKDKVEAAKEILIRERSKRVSGLSLSSLKAKKAHEQQKREKQPSSEVLPTDPFTEEELQTHWNAFIKKLENSGKKILASSLATDVPKVSDGYVISIELPNHTMKKEIEREQSGLMNYLRKKLRNYDITLRINVNEEAAKQYAYTPEEKYEKLREKNPAIDLLKNQFDLEL
ncbi:DNA polymerase III subunit gamma/tau [Lentiprolixibacter aurantiacus]|uniref:DNA polymerase III subunit gamma/tau n=1 Tax=Lentiprolixibacter aurantiacus TaxID=2993939 RepID=A0AAE3SNS7_9FLAO|nr:DNA polymerase III subunit gamma/tau [Lentiprolixibacter aurantiacus]MCX2719954.1 DNA polymerase III subunit gamma/tau [Lentiprolixibacter aurantiacus]